MSHHGQTQDARQEGGDTPTSLVLTFHIMLTPPLAKLKPKSARERVQVAQSPVARRQGTK